MAILHLVCGLPGAGKTTLAKKLERDLPALRLSPDEGMAHFGFDGRDEGRRAEIEALQADIAVRCLALGQAVILENGFWSRQERAACRARAAAAGAGTKLHYLEVSRAELKRRLALRNAALPAATFVVSDDDIDAWWAQFEPPQADEL